MKPHEIMHPDYARNYTTWRKWRLTYEGGDDFIDAYLKKFSAREQNEDFMNRRQVTYCPAFASAAIEDIKNAIFQRITDVNRINGSTTYAAAMIGENGGIDRLGTTMNTFIGEQVLPELLAMQRVGIYVDMPAKVGETLADSNQQPYLYIYKTEDIRSWSYAPPGNPSEFSSILLRDHVDQIDPATKLPTGCVIRYRHIYLQKTTRGQRVCVQFYKADGNPERALIILEIDRIPFVMAKLTKPLLGNAANYQIAHLNLASSDIGYALKSNFPFYIEQVDPRPASPYIKNGLPELPPAVDSAEPQDDTKKKIQATQTQPGPYFNVGSGSGRQYPINTDAPAFIHPSPEPLKASMDKQKELRDEVRLIVNLAVATLGPKMASAESKNVDERGLEAGLSAIGMTLQKCENQIAQYWEQYEQAGTVATIKYPTKYQLKSSEDQRKEVDHLYKTAQGVPSLTYRRIAAIDMVMQTLGPKIDAKTLDQITKELMASESPLYDVERLQKDVEAGLVDAKSASELRGYPPGSAEKAQKERAERLAETMQMQQAASAAARGNPDGSPPGAAKNEKDLSQHSDMNADPGKATK